MPESAKQTMQVTYAHFVPLYRDTLSFDVKFLKQQHIYKNHTFDLNEVFGIDSTPHQKEDT